MSNTEAMELFEHLQAEVKQLRQTLNGVNAGLDNLAELCKPTEGSSVQTDPHAPHKDCHGCSGVGTEHCPNACDVAPPYIADRINSQVHGLTAVHDGTWRQPFFFTNPQTAWVFQELVKRCCKIDLQVQATFRDMWNFFQLPKSGGLFWVTLDKELPDSRSTWQVCQHPVIDPEIRLNLLLRVLNSSDWLIGEEKLGAYVVWAISATVAVDKVARFWEQQRAKNGN